MTGAPVPANAPVAGHKSGEGRNEIMAAIKDGAGAAVRQYVRLQLATERHYKALFGDAPVAQTNGEIAARHAVAKDAARTCRDCEVVTA